MVIVFSSPMSTALTTLYRIPVLFPGGRRVSTTRSRTWGTAFLTFPRTRSSAKSRRWGWRPPTSATWWACWRVTTAETASRPTSAATADDRPGRPRRWDDVGCHRSMNSRIQSCCDLREKNIFGHKPLKKCVKSFLSALLGRNKNKTTKF